MVPGLVLIRSAAVVALAACGALFADYTGGAPTYCTVGTGCAAIRQSGWGYVPGVWIPVPAVGAVAFALLLVVTLLPWGRRWLSVAGGLLAAVTGVTLLAIQGFVLGQFCTLCTVVDLAAVLAGAGALLLMQRSGGGEPLAPWAWALLGAGAFGATFFWPRARPLPDVPAEVKKLYQANKINVVEFADFQCPYCRRLHATLKKLNHEYQGRVNFVRLNMPLGGHSLARPAAHAFVCADQQGKGEQYGDFLFEEEALEHQQQLRGARELGLDLQRFQQCLTAPETDRRVERESKILRDMGFEGLPTTFVGDQKIIGAQSEEFFRAAYERAARGGTGGGVPWFVYTLVWLGVGGGLVWFGRRARPDSG